MIKKIYIYCERNITRDAAETRSSAKKPVDE